MLVDIKFSNKVVEEKMKREDVLIVLQIMKKTLERCGMSPQEETAFFMSQNKKYGLEVQGVYIKAIDAAISEMTSLILQETK